MNFFNSITEDFKPEVIHAAGTALTLIAPHQFWVDTIAFVQTLWNNDHLSPAEKHAAVKKDLYYIFANDLEPSLKLFGETFVDIAIKVAWMYITSLNAPAGALAAAAAPQVERVINSAIEGA